MKEAICGRKGVEGDALAGQWFSHKPRLHLTILRLRFFCCTILMTLLLLVSIVLSLALVGSWFWTPRTPSNVTQWARPPNIAFNGIQLPTNSSAVSLPISNTYPFLTIDPRFPSKRIRSTFFFRSVLGNVTLRSFSM
jgi:hypothetical protein